MVGNKKKLAINRRKATIIEHLGESTYTIKYAKGGKMEIVNVDRMYSCHKVEPVGPTLEPRQKEKRRERRRERNQQRRARRAAEQSERMKLFKR